MIALSNPEKIALLTDSTADLPAPMREGKPIYVVPLKIRCEDGEYSDGVDITAEGVYERLHRGELPRTSLPEGGVVSDTLDQIRADGYERVIAVMLSSGLSGTYNMVRLQAGQRDDLEIAVFDSRSGSLGIGIMVLQLWEEILSGTSWDTLVRERAPHLVANTFPFFSVDTLEYLRRGGRIACITACGVPCCPSSPSSPSRTTDSSRASPRCGAWTAGQDPGVQARVPIRQTVQPGRGQRRRAGGDGGVCGPAEGRVSQLRAFLGGGHGRHPQRLYRRRRYRRHPVPDWRNPFGNAGGALCLVHHAQLLGGVAEHPKSQSSVTRTRSSMRTPSLPGR